MADQPNALVILTRARKMLAEAKSIPEVKAIRDQGQAAIKWAKSRRDIGLEVQNGLLRWWAWGAEDDIDSGHIDKYREVSQQKYGQPNLTKGFLVPVRILQREVEKFEKFVINGY